MKEQAPKCKYCGATNLRTFEKNGEYNIGWCQVCWCVTDLREPEKADAK